MGVEVIRMGHLPRNGIAEALTQSDIHVTPSRWDEPLGLTTLEGLASGQAVVGSATGGTPELLGGAGRLFPREDPEALADLLEELILDPELRASWGRRARARAESLTWQRTWDGIARAAGLRATTTGPEPPMRILFLLPIGEYYSREWTGAIATITRHLARELGGAGHDVTVRHSGRRRDPVRRGTRRTPPPRRRAHAESRVAQGRLRHRTARRVDVARLRPVPAAPSRRRCGLGGRFDAIVVANDPAPPTGWRGAASRSTSCCGCTTGWRGPRPDRSPRCPTPCRSSP